MVVAANVVRERDGIPIIYTECTRGFGVRIVHPQNPKASSKNLSMTMLYLAPGGILEPHHHENEEIYFVLVGEGKGHFGFDRPIRVEEGMVFHLPPNAEHGLENTGSRMMKVAIATAPPFAPCPEWKSTTLDDDER